MRYGYAHDVNAYTFTHCMDLYLSKLRNVQSTLAPPEATTVKLSSRSFRRLIGASGDMDEALQAELASSGVIADTVPFAAAKGFGHTELVA